MTEATITITADFIAPIPVGNEVLVLFTEVQNGVFSVSWADCDPIIVDRTTSIVYGSSWVPNAIHAGDLELEKHTRTYRQKAGREPLHGRVVSCLVTARGAGKANHLTTILGIQEIPQGDTAYR